MNSTTSTRPKPAAEVIGTVNTSALTLIRAELGRAVRTRSTIVFLSVGAIITLAIFTVRVVLSGSAGESVSSDLIVLSSDAVGFVVMLCTALAVARDHQTGSIELVRVLVPARGRQILALASAHAILAITVVMVVTILGTAAILTMGASSFVPVVLANGFARLLMTTGLLAFAGAGVGAVCRSSAGTTFVVLTLYLLLPVALMIAGLAGQTWASAVSDKTLGLLASVAISTASGAWAATAGVALWAIGLIALGIIREKKGK